ncbi:hypothetical protein N657DRAFT_632768 [Parathielavia appendiculata]|uniref:Uncharacterized protein n=1 Tax=Parathielavia appendiculata TaxID=2587402 RepID=A0AAN6U1P2_9PEZI|nr:hypothetical protein N657DRAFT_632768 [Parathielavia appendiculata]
MAAFPAPWEGGIKEIEIFQAAMPEAYLVLWRQGPPDFPIDAQILGICGVSAENADPNKYGWMVADFLHWKTAFNAVHTKKLQVNAKPECRVSRQIGLSSLDISEFLAGIDGVDVVNDGIIDKVGDNNQDISSIPNDNNGFEAEFLKRLAASARLAAMRRTTLVVVIFAPITPEQDICDAVNDAQLPIMLVILSPFTGGWLCRPSVLNPACPNYYNMMRITAKSCGGAFASRFIRSFIEWSASFITQYQREKVKYDDPMPLRPSELQVKSFHQFQRQIHDRTLPGTQPASSTPGLSMPLATVIALRRAQHWGQPRAAINYANQFESFGEAFGGTKELQSFHLNFSQGLMPDEDDVMRVFDAIEFRASSNILAKMVAKAFNLPLPDDVKCRYWHDKSDGVSDEYYKRFQDGFGHEFKNVRYPRAARWLAAATALRFQNGSREDIANFMTKNVARFIDKIRGTQKMLLLEDQSVQRKGLNWIAALGLGGEVQESPTKAVVSEPEVAAAFNLADDVQMPPIDIPTRVASGVPDTHNFEPGKIPYFGPLPPGFTMPSDAFLDAQAASAPPKKSAPIVIKDSGGEVIDLAAATKTFASPAPGIQQTNAPSATINAPAGGSSKGASSQKRESTS